MSQTESRSNRPRSLARAMAPGPSRSEKPGDHAPARAGELRIGTSGWHYDSWRGPFYPADSKPREFLSFYVERFSTTGINKNLLPPPRPRGGQTGGADKQP